MAIDFVLRRARLPLSAQPLDIAFEAGRIVALEADFRCDAPQEDAAGRLVCAGLIETHLHLDKAGIIGRCRVCSGTLAEAVSETSKAKQAFTEEDVYARAADVVERAIVQGTTRIRTFVEVDPRAGFRSFSAIRKLKADYAHLVDIEICAFAQEGLTNEPETERMLEIALSQGADLIGGCPYTDPRPAEHISRIFELAQRFDVPVDFHLDFDLDPSGSNLPTVIAQTLARGYQGKVSVGHVTKLSAISPDEVERVAKQLAEAGITVTVLPATDLFLTGRDIDHLCPRGVAPAHLLARQGVNVTISTNNVLNPFTPFGDVSLMRMANLYANVAQLATPADLNQVFEMITRYPARLMGLDEQLKVGATADLVLFDAVSGAEAVATIAPAVTGWKNGVKTFERKPPQLYR
ncbi:MULTISPECIES: amidohydrolase family protein [Rhizobium/Agrobacterium group]|uniref:amidohydrolase family protein n=1 Tax=Rhizobium/Agrobacterium group TaxID=227290 RepID=UPI001572831B|nr:MULTISPECIES: amidohydrolase family protein [Rhizobium/Agrobacterium group]MCF1471649.1 amidohydrolase family protein [Allorhizobium ampelinum]NSZ52795.1 amidohydrolase family protein [Agrobacterium vitis]NTA31554.1 amidohydrolase family protein [Agrobacterium vitis]